MDDNESRHRPLKRILGIHSVEEPCINRSYVTTSHMMPRQTIAHSISLYLTLFCTLTGRPAHERRHGGHKCGQVLINR